MSNEKLSKVEGYKSESNFLKGSIQEELHNDEVVSFNDANMNLLKFHGTYQQDNRDERGGGQKHYSFMVRSRIPGGKVTAAQMLTELDLGDKYANGTVRVTDRQGFQLHGVLKGDLQKTIREINESKLSTMNACGDVCRNFMCCPAPYKNNRVYEQMQAMADSMAYHFRQHSNSYCEIWMNDGEQKELVSEIKDEPIYGKTYLPRKFKMAIALPEDNCVDVYTQDLGLIAVVENDEIIGYNVLVGGGQGMTPAKKDTFPALAKRLTFVTPDRVLDICEAVVKVQRDFGNREDRKFARMKYLIHNWGMEKFSAKVAEYYGSPLAEPHPADIHEVSDHVGWHEQGDGKWFLGVNVENGRLKDEGPLQLKKGLRTLLAKYPVPLRLTALQGIIFCDIETEWKDDFESILRSHGFQFPEEISLVRRYSIACPAMPTCGLAVTESERVMPQIIDAIEVAMEEQGIKGERIAIHMTGCPNGCARPYTPDIGLVGKARGKYTLYLGGNAQGTRLAFLYKDMVPEADLGPVLSPVFARFKAERQDNEAFGDFCHRIGKESLLEAVLT
ncbi:NADPH-dependent assimilatory sulfite reductase hemoprotein subunit [Planctomicrobium sp. SH668]|uniref:NADPH-dependent assimilatory sulfite reductase hemoprotein subunit n=1 Tax=Planctomicrobium sp. SH668 TaxID=3448126 RepID=UPI003F5C8F1E